MVYFLFSVIIALAFFVGFKLGRLRFDDEDRHEVGSDLSFYRSSHFYSGLSGIISGNPEVAIAELTKVVEKDTDAVEIYILLGDLYREKGQAERGIRIHKTVLHRPNLSRSQNVIALTSLALDFLKAGFMDRALRTFLEVNEKDPESMASLVYLEKIYEELGNWEEALEVQQRIVDLSPQREGLKELAFLRNKVGEDLFRRGEKDKSEKLFRSAIATHCDVFPAYLNLSDIFMERKSFREAERILLELIERDQSKAYLAFSRLERLDELRKDKRRVSDEVIEKLLLSDPRNWHARVFLSERGLKAKKVKEALEQLVEALRINPYSFTIHRKILKLAHSKGVGKEMIKRSLSNIDDGEPFTDPHVCFTCHYRAGEHLWRCPHCHSWGTFVEDRI